MVCFILAKPGDEKKKNNVKEKAKHKHIPVLKFFSFPLLFFISEF